MRAGTLLEIYIVGILLIWFGTSLAMKSEPTTHGQNVLLSMGCIGGLLWPLFLAYFIIASPFIAIEWWHSRGER